ncbi:hypothetical protein JCM5353_004961, partial [Sporobolomyces roseus]
MSTTRTRSPSPPLSPHSHSHSTSNDQPQSKRQRLNPTSNDRKTLPYEKGMHLAPMVRIGTLPTRLLALEYGAELVWGPEIVDKAIIGSTRTVDPVSGVISFTKNNRSIFDCHPLEKPQLIFQLGSADPQLAAQAMKVIEQDVAGVGLNCGCPKSFSLQGGMGAALLKDPERLCAILTALVESTNLPIDAKIRLLPLPSSSSPPSTSTLLAEPSASNSSSSSTPPDSTSLTPPTLPISSEPTLPLVHQILSTGISCLTVHCRTQTMRSSEPALHARLRNLITELQGSTSIPIVCNGDVLGGSPEEAGWGNFREVCEETGVESVMIARAAEANPSCFRKEGLLDPIEVVIPKLLRIAITTKNHFSNTKYVLNAINLHSGPTPPGKEKNRDYKLKMNKAKNYGEMGAIFGIQKEEVEELERGGEAGLKGLLQGW